MVSKLNVWHVRHPRQLHELACCVRFSLEGVSLGPSLAPIGNYGNISLSKLPVYCQDFYIVHFQDDTARLVKAVASRSSVRDRLYISLGC
jgi:hypothetical protein